MDDLFGFLVGAVVVVTVVILIVVGVTTGLANLYVILDQFLAGWWFLPVPLSWGLTGTVFFGLLYFACAESPEFRRPMLRPMSILVALAWLGATWLAGQVELKSEHPPRLPASLTGPRPTPPTMQPQPKKNIPTPNLSPSVVQPPPEKPMSKPPTRPAVSEKGYETAYVNTGQLNVRSGTGDEYGVVETLQEDASVQIYDRKTGRDGRIWAKIYPGGREGWVSLRRLRFEQAKPATNGKDNAFPSALSWALIDTNQANVRAGPGVNYDIVGKLNRGSLVKMGEVREVGDGAGWIHIESGGLSGWINRRLLRLAD